MICGFAVDDGAGPGGVVAEHASQVGPAGRCHVRTKLEIVPSQRAIKLVEHHSGLDTRLAGKRIDSQDRIEILTAIQDNPRSDRLPGKTCTAATRGNWNMHLT